MSPLFSGRQLFDFGATNWAPKRRKAAPKSDLSTRTPTQRADEASDESAKEAPAEEASAEKVEAAPEKKAKKSSKNAAKAKKSDENEEEE